MKNLHQTQSRDDSGPENVAGVQRRSLADALFKAIIRCRYQRVKFLLDNGVSPLVINDGNQNVLIAALYIPDSDKRDLMFRYLVKRKADCCFVDKRTGRDVTAWAAFLGRSAQIECIFESVVGEVDLHAKDNAGMTPLHNSVTAGHSDTVDVLIKYMKKYDLSLDIPDSLGLSPYIHARKLGLNNIAEQLRLGGCSTGIFDTQTYKTAEEWAEIGRKEREQKLKKLKEMEKTGLIHRQKNVAASIRLPALKVTCNEEDIKDEMHIETRSNNSADSNKSNRTVSPITIVGGVPKQRMKTMLKPHTAVTFQSIVPKNKPRRATYSAASNLSSIDYRLREDTKLLLSMEHVSSSNTHLNKSSYDNLCSIMDIVAQQCTHTYRPSIIPPKPKKISNKGKMSSLALMLRAGKKNKGLTAANQLQLPSSSRSTSPAMSEKRSINNMASFIGAISTSKNIMGDSKKTKKSFPTLSVAT